MAANSFGQYQLHQRIHFGRTTEVFRATRTDVEDIERIVAVKRLLPSAAEDEKQRSGLMDEARLAMQLTHGNIAQVLESGVVDGVAFAAVEYVDGQTLREVFERRRKLGEPLNVPFACGAITRLCEGLNYAHEKKSPAGASLNLVHGNLSPDNVLISYDGQVKIVDFGEARADGRETQPRARGARGTPGYMSPEQVQNRPLDRRSDIFCAGICLYELLTGEHLFSDKTDFAALQRVTNVDIAPPTSHNPDIAKELEQIVLKALAKDPNERFQTAVELHDELESFMQANGYLFGRKELSDYMAKLFKEEREAAAKPEEAESPDTETGVEDTGLSAFEDLEPVSTVTGLSSAPASPPAAEEEEPDELEELGPPLSPPSSIPPLPRYRATMLGVRPSPFVPSDPPPPPPQALRRTTPRPSSVPPPIPPVASPRPGSLSPAERGGAPASSVPPPIPPQARTSASVPPREPGLAGVESPLPTPVPSSPPPTPLSGPPSSPSLEWSSAPASTPDASAPSSSPPFAALGASLEEGPDSGDQFEDLTPPAAAGPAVAQVEPVPYDEDDDDEATGIYDMSLGLGEGFPSPFGNLDSGARTDSSTPPFGGLGAPSPFGQPAHQRVREESEDDTELRLPGLAPPEGMDVGPDYTEPAIAQEARKMRPGLALPRLTLPKVTLDQPRARLVLAGVAASAVAIALGSAVWSGSSRPGAIRLNTSPADAVVKMDGELVPGGSSPFVINEVEPDTTHMIDVSKAGHTNWSTSVRLQSGEDLELPLITLEPIKLESGFTLDSVPRGAQVFVDGTKQPQTTPIQVTDLEPGLHKIRVEKEPGYAPFETEIKVAAGRVLELPPAQLKRRAPAPSQLRPAQEVAERPPGASKSRATSVRRASQRAKRRASRLPRRVAAQAAAGGGAGFLRINTRPWSQVYVDNRLVGNTPQMAIQLASGGHKVTLVNPNFGIKKTISVNIRPGRTVTKIVDLAPGG